MSNLYDLNIYLVARVQGKDYPELSGLHISEPPRRPARGRSADRLILYLAMEGNAPLSPVKNEQILADMARLYYATPGSITSALRKIADEFNKLLLGRNLRLASSSRVGLGLLSQLVIRGEQIYLAQSGSTHTFLISAEKTEHFYDSEMTEQRLGQSRIVPLRFYQGLLKPGDTLILAAQPEPSWNTHTLAGLHGQGPESLRRRLFSPSFPDLNAVLIQARPGQGKSIIMPPSTRSGVTTTAAVGVQSKSEPIEPALTLGMASESEEATRVDRNVEAMSPMEGEVSPVIILPDPLEKKPVVVPETTFEGPDTGFIESKDLTAPSGKNGLKILTVKFMTLLLAIGKPIAITMNAMREGVRTMFGRLLPSETFLAIPSYVMAFIAIAIPAIIVTVASVAYFQLGRAAQYDVLYSQAERMTNQAMEQTPADSRRAGLEAALVVIDQTEETQITPETQALRAKVMAQLDKLDLVRRVVYQPAIIGGFPKEYNITRILLSENDLYMLEGNHGSVIRAELTDQGYEVDHTFQCGPDAPGAGAMGPIMDITLWPAGFNPNASVLAMDMSGNVLYCLPDEPPTTGKLASPPSEGWGELVAFSLDLGDTYVVDPPSNGVWRYSHSNFEEEPTLFFDEEIPYLQDVIDMVVDRDDLYLLHKDGYLTLCFYSDLEEAPTRCSNPSYIDFRPGKKENPLIPSNPFSQITITIPPDPSLFMLEPQREAVYHFSLRNLAFQYQYLPSESLSSQEATAFVIDPLKRRLFIAIGNQVFYGIAP